MIVRTALSAKRRGPAFAVVLFLSSACTSMLGIDGEYSASPKKENVTEASGGNETGSGGLHSVLPPAGGSGAIASETGSKPGVAGAHPGGASAVPDASVNRGGASAGGSSSGAGGASGGSSNSGSGGHPSSGGSATTETGGAGVVPPPDAAAPECPTGTYSGTYRGTHKPGAAVSVLSAPISGTITLHFTAEGSTAAMITGGLLDPLTDSTGGVAGTIRGTFDCTKGVGSATLSNAEVTTVVPIVVVAINVEGTIDFKIDGNGMLDGTFSEQETMNTSGSGSGTWSASQVLSSP